MEKEYSTDRHLVELVLEGNTSSFTSIISNTKGLVIQIVCKMINNQEDREDIIQEVYLKVYNKLSSFKFNSKLSTWIGTITYHTCINYLEKKKIPILDIDRKYEGNMCDVINKHHVDNQASSTEDQIFKKERAILLKLEVEKLPTIYKTIITLFHMEELNYKEISKITNLPVGTLKSYLFRARKQLRENLLLQYKKEDL